MLEKSNSKQLTIRYRNLIKFNNTIMTQIDNCRQLLVDGGQNPETIGWCYYDYDKCNYYIESDFDPIDFTQEKLVDICRSIEHDIEILLSVKCHTMKALRTYVPITYCPVCKDKVIVRYRISTPKPFCKECGSNKKLRVEF